MEKYEFFIEILKNEFAEFFRLIERGKVIKSNNLKARKKSIHLRKLLIQFRKESLEFEKERFKQVKSEEISNEIQEEGSNKENQ